MKSFTEAAERKSYCNRAVHHIWLSVLLCTLLWQLSLLLSNLLINTWSLPEQSRTTRGEIMEEYLASSLAVQKPCQTPFVYVSISDSHHQQPLAINGSLCSYMVVEEFIIQTLKCLDYMRHCVAGWITYFLTNGHRQSPQPILRW